MKVKYALIMAVLLLACSPSGAELQQKMVTVEGGYYFDISTSYLKGMLEKKDFTFINVHIPYEGEIEKTDLFIPYNRIENVIDKLPPNKDAKIVLYCRSGSMSTTAAKTLVRLGYKNIWNLEGGMIEWKKLGYPLLNKGAER